MAPYVRTLLMCLGMLATGPTWAAAEPPAQEPRAYEISEVRDQLVVLDDGEGHRVIVLPFDRAPEKRFFYGRDGRYFLQRTFRGYTVGTERFQMVFWDPRGFRSSGSAGERNSLQLVEGQYSVSCGERTTGMRELPAAEAKAVLDAGAFFYPLWNRKAYGLARDDEGTYFYVDQLRSAGEGAEGRGFRVYRGPRGAVRPLAMRNVVLDSAGAIFSTSQGRLRLIFGPKEASWIRGQSRRELVLLEVEDNRALIYTELGMYLGLSMGTPCDDL